MALFKHSRAESLVSTFFLVSIASREQWCIPCLSVAWRERWCSRVEGWLLFFNRYDDCDALDGTLDFSEHLLTLILVNKGYTANLIVLSWFGTLDTAETIRTSFQVSVFDEADVTYFNVSVFLHPLVVWH